MSEIRCSTIGRVRWETSLPGFVLEAGLVDCWRVRAIPAGAFAGASAGAATPGPFVEAPAGAFAGFGALLQPREKEKGLRYHREEDRRRFAVARGALRFLLGKYSGLGPLTIQLAEGVNKKPYMVREIGRTDGRMVTPQFNVSHSGDWILIAITVSPVGVDVERMDQAFDYTELLPINFSAAEATAIGGDRAAFYRSWTRKEALLKATGVGLVDALPAITVMDGGQTISAHIVGAAEDWVITSFEVDETHMGSLAVSPEVKTVRYRQLESD